MITFIQASKRYPGGHDALLNVSFELQQGEMAFLTGHSGAGKSTLLKLIALIERTSRGQVLINGENTAKVKRRRIPYFRRNIGIIFQDHQLLFDRTVYDNVALPLVIAGYPSSEIGRRVRAALDKVGLLNKEKSYPITLSGGEQQRVGIARAVVNKPALLLADEPTGNLDCCWPTNPPVTWIRTCPGKSCRPLSSSGRLGSRYWWPATTLISLTAWGIASCA